MVLRDAEEIGHISMVARHIIRVESCGIECGSLYVSDEYLLYIDEIQSVQFQRVTSRAWVFGLDALQLRSRSRYLESVSSRSVSCLYLYLVRDVAVEG